MAFLKGICGKFLLLEWKKSQTNKWKKEQIDTPRCMLTTRHTGQCLRLTVEKDMAWHDMLKLNVKCYSWMAWHDMTWHDTIYMTWHDMTWHDWQLKKHGWRLNSKFFAMTKVKSSLHHCSLHHCSPGDRKTSTTVSFCEVREQMLLRQAQQKLSLFILREKIECQFVLNFATLQSSENRSLYLN